MVIDEEIELLLVYFTHYWFPCKIYAFSAVIAQGINAGDVKKLQDAGIYTCNGLMMHTKKVYIYVNFRSNSFEPWRFGAVWCYYDLFVSNLQNLTGIKGLSEAKVEKICEAAEKIVVSAQIIHNLCNCFWNFHLF